MKTVSIISKRDLILVALFFLVVGPIVWFVMPNQHKSHPLYKAIIDGDVVAVQERLAQYPPELEYRFVGLNARPLHIAAGQGDTNMIALLISLGASIHAKGYRNGATPLHCAAAYGHVPAIEALVEHGADVGAWDHQWRTPLNSAANGDHAAAIVALLHLGANIDGAKAAYSYSPLREAVKRGCNNAARVLLEQGTIANYDYLIQKKRQELAAIPLASDDIKDGFRELITLLEEQRDKLIAQQSPKEDTTSPAFSP